MILAQHFSPEEDFYAIPSAEIYANNVTDAVNWQMLVPGKQVVKIATGIDLVKWQQHGFKIKLEQEMCKLFGLKAETEEESIIVEVNKIFSKVELPYVLEIELEKQEDGRVALTVNTFKNSPVELLKEKPVSFRSNDLELTLTAVDLENLPNKFFVKLESCLLHELQGRPLV